MYKKNIKRVTVDDESLLAEEKHGVIYGQKKIRAKTSGSGKTLKNVQFSTVQLKEARSFCFLLKHVSPKKKHFEK